MLTILSAQTENDSEKWKLAKTLTPSIHASLFSWISLYSEEVGSASPNLGTIKKITIGRCDLWTENNFLKYCIKQSKYGWIKPTDVRWLKAAFKLFIIKTPSRALPTCLDPFLNTLKLFLWLCSSGSLRSPGYIFCSSLSSFLKHIYGDENIVADPYTLWIAAGLQASHSFRAFKDCGIKMWKQPWRQRLSTNLTSHENREIKEGKRTKSDDGYQS